MARAFLFMWPNARISVMGGEQAASVLATVKRDGLSNGEREAGARRKKRRSRTTIRGGYEAQGQPYYSSARLWDDGIIDPAQTRDVLGLCISASLNAPIEPTQFGLFRM